MAAFVDDIVIMALCRKEGSFERAAEAASRQAESGYVLRDENGAEYGYICTVNRPLTELYGFPCRVVKFFFSCFHVGHTEEQEVLMSQLWRALRREMERNPGYYNIRVPSHVTDLIRAMNRESEKMIFCGGTVQELCEEFPDSFSSVQDCRIFSPDREYAEKNREKLTEIMLASFENFHGQYHISPVTSERAGEIYEHWIDGYFSSFHENALVVSEFQGEPAGIGAVHETEHAVDIELMAVSERFRGHGIYTAMFEHVMKYASEKNKICVSGTQMDHFISQCTWASLGFRPFYSIYNMHYDGREERAG